MEEPTSSLKVISFQLFAKVLLDQALDKPLDYGIPQHLEERIKPGLRVKVPLRKGIKKGTILSIECFSSFDNVQPIHEILHDKDVLSSDLFELGHWMSKYYLTPLPKVFHAMLPSPVRKDLKDKTQSIIKRMISVPEMIRHTEEIRSKFPSQAKVLDILLQNSEGLFLSELLEYPGITRSPIDTLIKKKILKEEEVILDRSLLEDDEFLISPPKKLSDEQAQALQAIIASLEKHSFQTHLLHGITGSGKTEVYLQAIDHTLRLNKSIIMLVPEIALTRQTIERLKSRFHERIAVLHHRLSPGQRFDAWHNIRKGEIPIIVGARSAIFSPTPNLGLIIIDEEHENSYKQMEEMPCYHARDVAIMRGKMCNAVVVLGSATPSLETYHNALKGKYTLHKLTKRASGSPPHVHIVNMHHEQDKKKGFSLFSDTLLTKMKERIDVGEQVILFLNRRGYFTCQVCKECKKPLLCEHCDVSLTYHRGQNILSCHVCGYTKKPPIEICPHCKKSDTLKYQGPGTEQIERALHAIFPGIRTLRMDRDTTKHKGSHDRIFNEFGTQKADVLIGTQMIAKGLHFPSVTLAAILGADSPLHIPDFRANEIAFQLIAQVSGRSGRGHLPGEVIIQSFLFDHPIIHLAAKEDYLNFYTSEMSEREHFHYPPFTRLIKIVFSSKNPDTLIQFGHEYVKTLRKSAFLGMEIAPLTPCAYAKIKDKHRYQCIIKTNHIQKTSVLLSAIKLKKPHSLSLLIDVDPLSTYS